MDERVVKFRVGAMVLGTLFLTGILVLSFGNAISLVRGDYTIYIHFDDAPGVVEGTPIRKSGILIGHVKRVNFAKQGGVNVECKIDSDVPLYDDEEPQVIGSLLGGDVVIQFVLLKPGQRARKPKPNPPDHAARGNAVPETRTAAMLQQQEVTRQPIAPGTYIEGSVAPNALQVVSNLEGDLSVAIRSLGTAGEEVGKLAGYFNKLFTENDGDITQIIDKAGKTLDSLQRALEGAEDLLGDKAVRDNLKHAIGELPDLLVDTRNAMSTVRGTVESMDRNLRNLEGLTGPLGDRGEQLAENIDSAVARLDDLLGNVNDFTGKLNRGEGTLNRLLNDPDLYQHLNTAALNVERITYEMRPIIADLRVFSDKVSRHPEVLVFGGLQKNPGLKGNSTTLPLMNQGPYFTH